MDASARVAVVGGSDGCNCKQWSGKLARTDENGGSAEALLHGDSTTAFNEGEERDDLCQWRGT
jgi:hypothetical protein